jgi:hypothetical protein
LGLNSLPSVKTRSSVLAGRSQKDDNDIDSSAYTNNQIDPNVLGFAVSFQFNRRGRASELSIPQTKRSAKDPCSMSAPALRTTLGGMIRMDSLGRVTAQALTRRQRPVARPLRADKGAKFDGVADAK